jgi:multidrug efflux pump
VFFVPLLYVIVAGTVRRWRKAPAAKPAEATIEAH